MVRKRIVVIDDDTELLEVLEYLLDKEGYKVETAGEPQKGIELVRLLKPDLILVDVMMPGMDGAQVVATLKEDPVLSSIPILFLSALASTTDQLRLSEIMVAGEKHAMIGKPFEKKQLVSKIQEILT